MTAVLLCLAALAADDPSAVRVKVLHGTGPSDEQRSDIELWISQTVAKNGSPLAEPYTGWIALTGDEQRLFMGWFFINGKASAGNGKYKVEINGCDGGPLQAKVTLKPGERRVISDGTEGPVVEIIKRSTAEPDNALNPAPGSPENISNESENSSKAEMTGEKDDNN